MFDKKQFDDDMGKVRNAQINDIAEYLTDYIKLNASIRDMKIEYKMDGETLDKLIKMPIPRAGRDPKQVMDELAEDVLQKSMILQHPRFFAFVTSAVSPYSLMASILTDIYNPHGGAYMETPGACIIEEKLISWMGGLAGYPQEGCGGLFVSGGSMANMTALIAARESRLNENEYPIGVAYLSDQTHSSVAKGLRMIGLRKDQIVIIPTDEDYKMRMDLLEEKISSDLAEGKKPFVVIGSLGTTNTGSIDPLMDIGNICQKYGLWFHVDGAYGGSVLFSDIYRNYAKGVELSDSLSWDTHKWALQIYSCSSLIVKNKDTLLNSFSQHPEYLEDIRCQEHNDPWDMGPEMTRPHRSLKLWCTLQAMGTDLLADVIDYSFYNANVAKRELEKDSNWEITSKPMCGAITFRFAPKGYNEAQLDEINSMISKKIIEDGYAFIVTTVLKGKRVLRLCLINGNTTTDDVIGTIDYLKKISHSLG